MPGSEVGVAGHEPGHGFGISHEDPSSHGIHDMMFQTYDSDEEQYNLTKADEHIVNGWFDKRGKPNTSGCSSGGANCL